MGFLSIFTSAKNVVMGLAALLIVGLVVGFWYNYHQMQLTIQSLGDKVAASNAAFALQKTTNDQLVKINDSLHQDLVKQQELATQFTSKFEENAQAVSTLRRVLAKHNLEKLANAKPSLIQDLINRGTLHAWCLRWRAGHPDTAPNRTPAQCEYTNHPPTKNTSDRAAPVTKRTVGSLYQRGATASN